MLQNSNDSQSTAREGNPNFSLRNIVTILYRRRVAVLAIALPLIIIGGINLFSETGSYTASARAVVDLGRVDLPKWRTGLQGVDYNRDLNTLVNSAMTMPVAQRAAEVLRDSIPVMIELDEGLAFLTEKGALQDYLLENLDVSVMGESAVMNFQFTSSRPRISLMAVGALRQAFLDFKVYGQKNEQAVEYYQEQANRLRAKMDSLLVLRSAILTEAGYTNLDDDLKYDSGALAQARTELSEIEVDRRALERQVNQLRAYLGGDPRDFPMGPDENRSNILVYWMRLIAQHDDELNTLLTTYTENSPTVKRKQELIAESLKELEEAESKYVKSMELQLSTLLEKETVLKEQLASVEKRNSRAPAVYRQVTLIDSELKSHGSLLVELGGKIGEVSLATNADERISDTSIIDEPTIVAVFSGGTTIVYFLALVILALALGVIVGFVVENLDHRVYSPDDIEENLKLPVFASVSRNK